MVLNNRLLRTLTDMNTFHYACCNQQIVCRRTLHTGNRSILDMVDNRRVGRRVLVKRVTSVGSNLSDYDMRKRSIAKPEELLKEGVDSSNALNGFEKRAVVTNRPRLRLAGQMLKIRSESARQLHVGRARRR